MTTVDVQAHRVVLYSASIRGKIDLTCVKKMFEEIGPTPRICIDLMDEGQLLDYQNQLENAIGSLSLELLKKLPLIWMLSPIRLFSSAARTTLKWRRWHPSCFMSSQDLYVWAFQQEQRNKQLDFYRDLECLPYGRPLAGLIYESLVHQMLAININLELVPMVRLDGHTEGGLSQWYSSHQVLDFDSLEALHKGALQQTIKIQFMLW